MIILSVVVMIAMNFLLVWVYLGEKKESKQGNNEQEDEKLRLEYGKQTIFLDVGTVAYSKIKIEFFLLKVAMFAKKILKENQDIILLLK